MMTLVKILLFMSLLSGCATDEKFNEYVFSERPAEWYVIINGCTNGEDFAGGKKRRFVFPESGILLANIENFNFTEDDVFFIGQKPFNPNSEDKNSYKLCYHMVSKNSGYADEQFDFYFFRVSENCRDEGNIEFNFFDNVLEYLKSNGK